MGIDYKQIAKESRLKILDLVYEAGTSHIGSLLGAADIFAVLFEKIDLDKDKFVLSAGWKAALLYYHLWRKGRISTEELNSYCKPGSKFIGLAEPVLPGLIDISGGSMGLGFPGAVGIALAKKLKGEEGIVVCLMSDGEQAIGTTHESALIVAHHNLKNLVVVIDNNGFQAMGKTNEVLKVELESLWKAWGWDVSVVDGHDYTEMAESIISFGKPRVIICNTTKGKGVSFMENDNLYHYKQLDGYEYIRAREELCQS